MTQKKYVKFQLLALVLLGGVALYIHHHRSRTSDIQYPRIVFNRCTGLYAVQTGECGDSSFTYFGTRFNRWDYTYRVTADGAMIPDQPIHAIRDTTEVAFSGYELTFPDSIKARDAWNFYQIGLYMNRFKDSMDMAKSKAEKRADDSIFKCKHNYQ